MSPNAYEIVLRLTNPELPTTQRRIALREFALLNGWRPSDEMDDYPGTRHIANGHLVVEHGLDNSAVISFLNRDRPFLQLERVEQNRLLCISYNNMVDWHVFPDLDGTTFVYNRVDPHYSRRISHAEQTDSWRVEAFDQIAGRKPNSNLKPLDDALMETISFWKRALSIELGKDVSNDSLATLFNAIIFVRALEDHYEHKTGERALPLTDDWISLRHRTAHPSFNLTELLAGSLARLGVQQFPSNLLEKEKLKPFHKLDSETISRLLRDFYDNKYAPIYRYDFSLMSKHALSRIYEHYVSLLRTKESSQLNFFPQLPDEERNKATGGVYTPQYIARFFARYLKENLTPKVFRQLKTCDPACGSGIFLRTLLEMQCDPLQDINPRDVAEACFPQTFGIDVDPNACQASRLSLSLLHLVLAGKLPASLNILNSETIESYISHKCVPQSFDVLIGNPPFIKWDLMSSEIKQRVSEFMADYSVGKVDMFLPVLKISMDLLKPDGLLLFVLPHSFLFAKNARQLRKEILNDFWIRFLGDISDVRVFGETGAYVILLILQKKNPQSTATIPTIALQCRDFVGHALQDVVEGKFQENDFYSIFVADSKSLTAESWTLVKPEHSKLQEKFRRLPRLDEFLSVQEGFVTGADSVFIRNAHEIPKNEKAIYIPYLSDREMERFQVPRKVPRCVFHPYLGDKKLSEGDLRENFKDTWEYLKANSKILRQRSSVKAETVSWWCPHRPLPIVKMLRPKLISPHLIVIPRFSFDEMGKYAVSRSPWLVPKEESMDRDMLLYFLAILNSTATYWQIMQTSHKYSRGYAMLEKKTLRNLAVPNPKNIEPGIMKKLISLVEKRLGDSGAKDIDAQLDELVSQLFNLSKDDRHQIGLERTL